MKKFIKISLVFFVLFSSLVNATGCAIFETDFEPITLKVDLSRKTETIHSAQSVIHKTDKFGFDGRDFFIGSVFDKKNQKHASGLFEFIGSKQKLIIDGGAGFYSNLMGYHLVVLHNGFNTQSNKFITKFYNLPVSQNSTPFELLMTLNEVAIMDLVTKYNKHYVSGYSIDRLYAAELIQSSGDGIAFKPLKMLEYIGYCD